MHQKKVVEDVVDRTVFPNLTYNHGKYELDLSIHELMKYFGWVMASSMALNYTFTTLRLHLDDRLLPRSSRVFLLPLHLTNLPQKNPSAAACFVFF